jgi:hypothetical protein
MWDQVGQLHAYHGDVPVEIRLLKLTEEVGGVARLVAARETMQSAIQPPAEARRTGNLVA